MQLRRVLLLFALVLGISALVASIAPPPDTGRERSRDDPELKTPSPSPPPVTRTERVRFDAPAPGTHSFETPTRLVRAGSSLAVQVSVPEPGDVALDGLGLRQTADPLTPARFELLAEPVGRYAVLFLPVRGDPLLAGRLEFSPARSARPRGRASSRGAGAALRSAHAR